MEILRSIKEFRRRDWRKLYGYSQYVRVCTAPAPLYLLAHD
ncbi:MAG TPA: hypothetical protein VM911_21760 [Pyrinomonadaceae bacterium]|nr:hypothetical protein [Pyrinomonadaceae bacterium]